MKTLLLTIILLASLPSSAMTLTIRELKSPHRIVQSVAKLPNRGLVIKQVEGQLQITKQNSAGTVEIIKVPFDLGSQYYEVRVD